MMKNNGPIQRKGASSIKERLISNPNLLPRLLLGGIGALFVVTGLIFFGGSDNPDKEGPAKGTSFDIQTENGTEMTFEDMLGTDGRDDMFELKDVEGEPVREQGERTFDFSDTPTTSGTYANENDPTVKELQRQILLMEEKRKHLKGKNPSSASSNPVPQKVEEQPKPKTKEQLEMEALQAERDYYEMLKRSKEEMIGSTGTEMTASGSPFRASIYRDQFILPGDRVKLLLNEDVDYQGNIFKRNTIVYAMANINKSRVLLDVANINHVPVDLEIRDIDDGGVGLYNKRAGELWREFQGQVQQNATQDIGRDISQEVRAPIIGSAVRAFDGFFQRKRYKERDKILLVNDHQVLISPKTN